MMFSARLRWRRCAGFGAVTSSLKIITADPGESEQYQQRECEILQVPLPWRTRTFAGNRTTKKS